MKVIIADRGRGKTTGAVEVSARTGATIICANITLIEYCKRIAERMELKIPEPVTYIQFISNGFEGTRIESVIIDDLDCMLRTVFKLDQRNILIDAITLNANNVKMELES